MIITVTLNPAVDKTVNIENFQLDTVNRISSARLDAGGKGINVSKVIVSLGGKSKAMGFLAGNTGNFIKEYLDQSGIENDFIFVAGETRTNIKIVDPLQGTNTDINENGPAISAENMEQITRKILGAAAQNSVLVFSGSVPQNAGKDIYLQWIQGAKAKGAKTILDADGDLMRLGIEAGPYLIKPNIHELERLAAKKLEDVAAVVKFTKELLARFNIEVAAVSMGAEGALFINREHTILAHGLKVEVKSTVGAGDSMVAALAYALDNGYEFLQAIRLAVATGAANVMTSGTQPGEIENIRKLEEKVTWEYV
jgi:1-phosphofructokinase